VTGVVLQQVVERTVGVSYSIAGVIWVMAILAGGLGGYLYGLSRRK
jgi:hypothetical protein